MTLTVDVRTPDGGKGASVELPAEVFDVQVNIPLIHQVVVAQLAAARQGTHDTKTRGEVRGGGKKPYRQKGTGRARQGSTRAPQFAGGGTVHGPTPRDYSQKVPKKMKAAALRGALSDRARNGRVHVISALVRGDAPSTKTAVAALASLTDRRHVLVVVDRDDLATWKSLRNVDRAHVIAPDQLNTYDVLVSDDVVFTQTSLQTFLAKAPGASSAAARVRGEAAEPAPKGTETTAAGSDLTPKNLPDSAPSISGAGATDEAPAAAAKPAKSASKPAEKAAEPAATDTPPAEEAPVSETPATDAGTTAPAGEGVGDQELTEQVAKQTDPNLGVEAAFENETDVPAGDTGNDDGPKGGSA